MTDIGIVLGQTRYWILTSLRDTRSRIFSLLLPVILLALFNSVFARGRQVPFPVGGVAVPERAYFTAGMIAYAIMLSTFTTLSVTLVAQRETGQLKRLRGTPMPAWTFVVSMILRSTIQAVVMTAILLAVGHFAYKVQVPEATALGLAIYVLLGTATLSVLGIALTVIVESPEAASAAGPFVAVMLSFISGVFVPTIALPNWLADIGKFFPLAPLAEGIQRSLSPTAPDFGLSTSGVVTLVLWAVAGLVIATRGFRWEPQTGAA